jgi:hypothetical protein
LSVLPELVAAALSGINPALRPPAGMTPVTAALGRNGSVVLTAIAMS